MKIIFYRPYGINYPGALINGIRSAAGLLKIFIQHYGISDKIQEVSFCLCDVLVPSRLYCCCNDLVVHRFEPAKTRRWPT